MLHAAGGGLQILAFQPVGTAAQVAPPADRRDGRRSEFATSYMPSGMRQSTVRDIGGVARLSVSYGSEDSAGGFTLAESGLAGVRGRVSISPSPPSPCPRGGSPLVERPLVPGAASSVERGGGH